MSFAWASYAFMYGAEVESYVVVIIVLTLYSAYLSFFGALFGSVIWTSWKLTGPWTFIGLGAIPLTIALAFYLGSDAVLWQYDHLKDAVIQSGQEHEWRILDLGAGARAGPIALIFGAPLLLLDLMSVAFDLGVFLQVLGLMAMIAVIFLMGFLPSAVFSLVVMTVAYVRKFSQRHDL